MNSKENILTSTLLLVVGVALIALYNKVDLFAWIVIAIGILFIVPSLYNLIMLIVSKRENVRTTRTPGVISSVGGLCLGICMLLEPNLFAGILVYLFASLLVIGGISQIALIAYGTAPLKAPLWMYIVPVLTTIAGVVMLCTSLKEIQSVAVLVTGIAFVVSAINSLLVYVGARSVMKSETSVTTVTHEP
ncbi:MAG: DUF308 domain-containing protein [Pseudoflavonifractor sp.]|nr:DUF308 domain-containing protein [Pseudoflavonifractor sp.]